MEELIFWKDKWNVVGFDVFEIDYNWCYLVYILDLNGNMVEFCLIIGVFINVDWEWVFVVIDEIEFNFFFVLVKVMFWKDDMVMDLM